MQKRHGIILAVIGYIVFFFCLEGWGEDWKKYAESEKMFFYYDTEGITRPSTDVVSVREKRVYKVKVIMEMVEKFGKKYETLSHAKILVECQCEEKKVRTLSEVNYSTDGGILSSDFTPVEWTSIASDSIGESLYEILCK